MKLKDSDKIMVVCADQSRYGVPGSWADCEICGDRVYLSDSSLRSVELNGYKKESVVLYCIECAVPKLGGIQEFIPPTEEQKREVRLNLLRGNYYEE